MAFEVATYDDLKKVGSGIDGWNLDSEYIQTADINCDPAVSFTPIGNWDTKFTGTYDGQDFKISNLLLGGTTSTSDYLGLFGVIEFAELRNIRMVNAQLYTQVGNWNSHCGLLVAISTSSVIRGCQVSGYVRGQWSGGLFADIYTTTVEDCKVEVDLDTVGDHSGYIYGVGVVRSGTVRRVRYEGTLNNKGYRCYSGSTFGLYRGSGTIEDCYSDIIIQADTNRFSEIGFFVEVSGNDLGQDPIIKNCYVFGEMKGTADRNAFGFSELFLSNGATATYENCYTVPVGLTWENRAFLRDAIGYTSTGCYYDSTVSGVAGIGATGKTTAEMKTLTTFTPEWDMVLVEDFNNHTWYLNENTDYPKLGWDFTSEYIFLQGEQILSEHCLEWTDTILG